METTRTEAVGNEAGRRALILRLAEHALYPLVTIFMRNGVLANELVKIVEWAAARAAMHEPEFAVPGRTDKHAQSAAHAAVLTGLQRARIGRIAKQEEPPVYRDGGELHRLLRILTAWRTEPRYQDETGKPLDIRLNGSHPSLHQLRVKYGNDTTTRAIADALVLFGCAEWVGENDIMARDKKLRFISGVIAADHNSHVGIQILTQATSDFMHSLKRALGPKVRPLPRFREGYFDVDIKHVDAAQEFSDNEVQSFNSRFLEGMKNFRAEPGKPCVRMGVGSYTFRGAPLLFGDLRESSQHHDCYVRL